MHQLRPTDPTSDADGGELGGSTIGVLGGFSLVLAGRRTTISRSAQRLVAFLALHLEPVPRAYVAFHMWLDKPEKRALANLRSVLWRLRDEGTDLVVDDQGFLSLRPGIGSDYGAARAAAVALMENPSRIPDRWTLLLRGDVLPGWYEDWVIVERESFRQLRLHALETASSSLIAAGRTAEAIQLTLAVIAAEPLRESAHRVLVEAHIAEGNITEANSAYVSYRDRLWQELGLRPSWVLQVTPHGAANTELCPPLATTRSMPT